MLLNCQEKLSCTLKTKKVIKELKIEPLHSLIKRSKFYTPLQKHVYISVVCLFQVFS